MATEEINLKVKSDISETTKDASGLASEFRILGVSLNDVKKGFVTIGMTAKKSFATIRAGIMSTGIGALLIAITSLVTYFTNSKRGADDLKVTLTALGTVVDVIKDRLTRVGEALKFVFSGDFRKAGELLKDVHKGIAEEIRNEVEAMTQLERRTQALRDADNDFMVQKAKTRQEIERARLIAEDETKSAQERLENLKKALELEEKTTKRELELAKERMKIQEEQMALSENTAEDEQRLAQLKTELIEKETASIKMRRRVVTEVNALEREIHAEEKARQKEKDDAEKKKREDQEKAEKEAREKKEKEEEEAAEKKKKAEEKAAQDEIDLANAVEGAKEKLTQQGFSIAEGLAGKSDKMQKAVAVAKTIYNTQQAIMKTMAEVPAPFNVAQSIATGLMGAMSIQKILSTSPDNASAGGGATASGGSTPAPQMVSGAFDLSGVTKPEPVQAFVVTDDMTESQDKLATIRRRATI